MFLGSQYFSLSPVFNKAIIYQAFVKILEKLVPLMKKKKKKKKKKKGGPPVVSRCWKLPRLKLYGIFFLPLKTTRGFPNRLRCWPSFARQHWLFTRQMAVSCSKDFYVELFKTTCRSVLWCVVRKVVRSHYGVTSSVPITWLAYFRKAVTQKCYLPHT